MLRYRDGDAAAFEMLYRRHKDGVYRYLLRLSGHRDAADDVFQEVWGKIIRARDRYRPTARFSTFLYRVAHNCFIDHIRRNQRHAQAIEFAPDRHPDPGEAPDRLAERAFAKRRLDAAIAALPEEQREVFLLRTEADLDLEVIAKITGTNRETAKSRLRYAVNKLRKSVETT
jgi:RNA polymerase sigma-70 factor (ECF subfamily)